MKHLLTKIIDKPLLVLAVLKELTKWALSGFKTRSEPEIYMIFRFKCQKCPHFNMFTESEGECEICGCYLKSYKNLLKLNKIQHATTHCPDRPPRW